MKRRIKRCPTYHKVMYRDEVAAKFAMSQIGKTRHGRGGIHLECRAYRCPACNQWHLTKQEKR